MHHHRLRRTAVLALTFLVLQPPAGFRPEAFACACCAEPNWYRNIRGLMPYEMTELTRLQPVGEWTTFVDRRDPAFQLPQVLLRLRVESSGWSLLDSAWRTQCEVPDTLTPAGTFSWMLLVSDGQAMVDSLLFRYDSASQSQIDMRFILSASDYTRTIGDDAETVLCKEVNLYGTLEHLGDYLTDLGFDLSGKSVIRFHGRGNVCFAAQAFDDWSMSFEVRSEDELQNAQASGVLLIE